MDEMLNKIAGEYPVATIVTNSKVEEKVIALTVIEKKDGKGDFIINTGDFVITLPLEKIKLLIGGD
jgi:hypothetical protein